MSFFALAITLPGATLAPTGSWTMRADDDLCRLERSYPADKKQVTLAFQPLLVDPRVAVIVNSPDKSDRQYAGNVTLTVTPSDRHYSGSYVSSAMGGMRTTRLTVDGTALTDLQDGDVLHIEAKPVEFSLAISHPAKAQAALAGCVIDLKRSWGIERVATPTVAATIVGDPSQFFGPDNYPAEALHRKIEGKMVALLTVSADGAVEHCRIGSSAAKELDEGTCKAAARIRFAPAQDKNNEPVPSTYILSVRWTLPSR